MMRFFSEHSTKILLIWILLGSAFIILRFAGADHPPFDPHAPGKQWQEGYAEYSTRIHMMERNRILRGDNR
jgi:hypothetical protein